MPKRTDLDTILVLGAGPILIGQAAEFDYSGTQAVQALRREGYRVVLINSNPATIMTDPEVADATYVEPLTPEVAEAVIARERPRALLPTVGGQTGLNLAMALHDAGVLERYDVELLGASARSIRLAEDRKEFARAMEAAGLRVPRGGLARSMEEVRALASGVGRYPILIRPSFTLGGSGAGTARNPEELEGLARFGLDESPVGSVMIEESLAGWKEFELEVMADSAGRFVVVCCIENFDPMGVHTGDSITVAPAMTLTDREYQRLRDAARRVMEAVGVSTGGANVQFAVEPRTGEVVVIEMNPRVSRSSALASKATGFPIARLAALVAVGYRLDELPNDITGRTVAAFEPTLDYVVAKIPRWSFEKFAGADTRLGPYMRSVGEAMAIGRTFQEALLKGLQSLELSRPPFPTEPWTGSLEDLAVPRPDRLWELWAALRAGVAVEDLAAATAVDPWFLGQMAEVVDLERSLAGCGTLDAVPEGLLRQAKRAGFGDAHLAWLLGPEAARALGMTVKVADAPSEAAARATRRGLKIHPTFHMVDTCAAEFASATPYLYGSYESESEAPPTAREKVVILGGGPNRIGQGIEFDYCCVHAAQAVREAGLEAVMVNCNPETVSTDYDTSDRLYFEPLTVEHVLAICRRETPLRGVIAQFGGQTPLKLVHALEDAGVRVLGTPPDAIDQAEDRDRFLRLMDSLEIPVPAGGMARSLEEAREVAARVGYPAVVRPSYVLGGRAMAIVHDEAGLERYLEAALEAAEGQPILLDHFLEDAYEVEVDAVCDGRRVVVGGLMQQIEEAGVHSGDSACVMPPYKISAYHLGHIREYTREIALALGVVGLVNLQFAIQHDVVYVLEVNPRASRTVPYVAKATGVPLANLATRVCLGESLAEVGLEEEPPVKGFYVKEAVLPFKKFEGVDALLGPEMRSTGEVMGHSRDFGPAFAKAQAAAGNALPSAGTVFLSVNDFDKSAALKIARDLHRLGFRLIATRGTAEFFSRVGLPVEKVLKVSQGSPNVVERLAAGEVDLVISTPYGPRAYDDGARIRAAAVRHGVPLVTTLSAAQAAVLGIKASRAGRLDVRPLQEAVR